MDELPANVQAKILQQMSVDDTLSPTPLLASEMNQVADTVIQGVNDFAKVLPQIITLREYFETAERDSANRLRVPIKSCHTWTEFCRMHLGANIRTIQRLLKDVNKKPKLESDDRNTHCSQSRQDSHDYMAGLGAYYNTLKHAQVVPWDGGFQVVDSNHETIPSEPEWLIYASGSLAGTLSGLVDKIDAVFKSASKAADTLNTWREEVEYAVDRYTDQDLCTVTLRCCGSDFPSLAELQTHRQEIHKQAAVGGNFRRLQSSTASIDAELTSLFPPTVTAEVVEKDSGQFLVSIAFHGDEETIRNLAIFVKSLMPAAESKPQEWECEDTVI